MNNAQFLIQVCKGLIRGARARRTLMFYSVLIALVLLFAGSTFLWPLLREHPLIFIGYWFLCAWITLLAVLLALYDLLRVRAEAEQVRRELERECGRQKQQEVEDENSR